MSRYFPCCDAAHTPFETRAIFPLDDALGRDTEPAGEVALEERAARVGVAMGHGDRLARSAQGEEGEEGGPERVLVRGQQKKSLVPTLARKVFERARARGGLGGLHPIEDANLHFWMLGRPVRFTRVLFLAGVPTGAARLLSPSALGGGPRPAAPSAAPLHARRGFRRPFVTTGSPLARARANVPPGAFRDAAVRC